MKRQLAFAAIAASQCLYATPAAAAADFQTVQGLYRMCTHPSHVQQSYCFGFVDGVEAALHASTALLEARGIHANLNWCATGSPTREQKVQAFKNWHDRHPDLWQDAPELGVIAALRATWPCPAAHTAATPD